MEGGGLHGGGLLMGRYALAPGEPLGSGSFSVCLRGTDTQTGQAVAVKVYKRGGEPFTKFKRQIEVLRLLQQEFDTSSATWTDSLEGISPQSIFLQLLDFSRDIHGNAGFDPDTGGLYVVTDLGEVSLDKYIRSRREELQRFVPKETVRNLSNEVLLVMAGLHAKGLVHLDVKPSNLMFFDDKLKLIDVDGCLKTGEALRNDESSISWTPHYCSPEWARFLSDTDEGETIRIAPGMDAWSVGITLYELVMLMVPWCNKFNEYKRQYESDVPDRPIFEFLHEFLGRLDVAPLPKQCEERDADFYAFLMEGLLVCDAEQRMSCSECLRHRYIVTDPGTIRKHSSGIIEDTSAAYRYNGTLWKLKVGTDLSQEQNWVKKDMYVSVNGDLCYFSKSKQQRFVLMAKEVLANAQVLRVQGAARRDAFLVLSQSNSEDERLEVHLAGGSEQTVLEWTMELENAQAHGSLPTMHLGKSMAKDFKEFRLEVANQRMPVKVTLPVYKGILWKLKVNGDPMNKEDWRKRLYWVDTNGALVYWSVRDNQELAYYSAEDITRAEFTRLQEGTTAKHWVFQIQVKGPMAGTPGWFSAQSEAVREDWIRKLVEAANVGASVGDRQT